MISHVYTYIEKGGIYKKRTPFPSHSFRSGQMRRIQPECFVKVVVQRVTFQFQCSSESTNGTGVQGWKLMKIKNGSKKTL